jgi:hypothetical protein
LAGIVSPNLSVPRSRPQRANNCRGS